MRGEQQADADAVIMFPNGDKHIAQDKACVIAMTSLHGKVQDILETAVATGPAGCVFAAIDRDGKILVKAASGHEELGNTSRPMKTDSLFCLYSCTKAIAGIALMKLVEDGKAKLDDPVGDVLPEVGNATFIDGRKPKIAITLRHLLTHTAGYGYTFFNPTVKEWAAQNGGIDEFCGTIEGFKSPLIAEPGEDWNYGVNMDWAGEYLHRVTGQTLGQYCKTNIFEPLGADDIEFGLLAKNKDRLVAMHQRSPDGKLSIRDHMPFTYHSTIDSGGAGCVGTIESYLKCVQILMNEGVGANGVRILKAETVKEMLRDQLDGVRVASGIDPMDRDIPDITKELTFPIQMMPGQRKGWGITFQIIKDDFFTGRKANSIWWAGLPNNYWQVDPTSGIATMLLSQSFPFNDPAAIMPWLNCESEVYKSLTPSE